MPSKRRSRAVRGAVRGFNQVVFGEEGARFQLGEPVFFKQKINRILAIPYQVDDLFSWHICDVHSIDLQKDISHYNLLAV